MEKDIVKVDKVKNGIVFLNTTRVVVVYSSVDFSHEFVWLSRDCKLYTAFMIINMTICIIEV